MKYISIIRINIKNKFIYNWSVVFNIFCSIISIIALLFFWKALYKDDNQSFLYMANYVVIAELLSSIYSLQAPNILCSEIRGGGVSIELLRPWNYILTLFFGDIGKIIAGFFTTGIPIILITKLTFDLYFPSIYIFSLFILNVFLSIIILFLIKIIVSMACFWIFEAWSMLILVDIVIRFFSGKFIPSWLMPSTLKNIIDVLPFVWIFQKPIELYLSGYNGTYIDIKQFVFFIGLQMLWIIILFTIQNFLWKRAITKIIE